MQDDHNTFRKAVRDFIIKTDNIKIKTFREQYDQVLANIDGKSWVEYWNMMTRNYEWVDYAFIQSTAWFLNHDILIVGTTCTKNNPYMVISGNLENEDQVCIGDPLLLGCKSDVHYQSLLPGKGYTQFHTQFQIRNKNVSSNSRNEQISEDEDNLNRHKLIEQKKRKLKDVDDEN